MGSYGLNLQLLQDLYGIECLEADDRVRPPSPHTVAIFQDPNYDFMVFPMVVDWQDAICCLYALRIEEGIGSRNVVPSMEDITIEMLRDSNSDDVDYVGTIGPHPHEGTIAEYIKGYIDKGEWARWFP